MRRFLLGVLLCVLGGCASTRTPETASDPQAPPSLGNFSVSLAVKDLAASRAFYETLGFRTIAGDASQNWLILQNDTATIGIFQGMFEDNILTFNPGWDRNSNTLTDFDDVREIQRRLKAQGVAIVTEADEATTGPASFIIVDPDGNTILVDQHVDEPGK